jgi:hypothetical protein
MREQNLREGPASKLLNGIPLPKSDKKKTETSAYEQE